MDGKKWLKVVIFLCLIAVSTGREFKVKAKNKHHAAIYNHTLATILVEYASAVYVSDLTELFAWTCSRCNDLTKGFQILELIVDVQRCLQAFVGVAQDLNAIVIAFRGTQESSLQNWIEDLNWKQLDISYPGMEDAMVCVDAKPLLLLFCFFTFFSANSSSLPLSRCIMDFILLIITRHCVQEC
uniref:Lipase n=1 Tax=Solanum tuberosum TaxID=4113 RepID=M1C2H5_SOLTU